MSRNRNPLRERLLWSKRVPQARHLNFVDEFTFVRENKSTRESPFGHGLWTKIPASVVTLPLRGFEAMRIFPPHL